MKLLQTLKYAVAATDTFYLHSVKIVLIFEQIIHVKKYRL